MNGESPRSYETNKTLGTYKRRVPGLRDSETPPPCKVYKIQPDGSLKLDRIENVKR